MANRCSFMTVAIPAKLNDSAAKFRVSTLRNHHAEAEISPSEWKKLTLHNKVFEDRENGVICYRDEKGELICEGYDEGPRFSQGLKMQRRKTGIGKRRKEMLRSHITTPRGSSILPLLHGTLLRMTLSYSREFSLRLTAMPNSNLKIFGKKALFPTEKENCAGGEKPD
ncbi:hypothetical protein KSP39_PZI016833 [Platanthera zijinensis]|uniref:Uncharacterized protein n=1 Tax=Platanthera zijinensis TaxID=2320716 RepID=A0AAP0B7M3_9ASPA